MTMLPQIYGFVVAETLHKNCFEERTLCHAFALNEHGGIIAYHPSSTREWSRRDMLSKIDIYNRIYPCGYEFFWVDPPEHHAFVYTMAEKLTFPIWCNGVSEIKTRYNIRLVLKYDHMPNLDELFAKEYR